MSSGLKSVVIPPAVTSVGEEAFSRCFSLEEVQIPDSVSSLGGGAFFGCRSLPSLTVPASVVTIGAKAFGGVKGGIPVVCYNGPAEGSPWGAEKHVRR